jgi:hypothetical protein
MGLRPTTPQPPDVIGIGRLRTPEDGRVLLRSENFLQQLNEAVTRDNKMDYGLATVNSARSKCSKILQICFRKSVSDNLDFIPLHLLQQDTQLPEM